MASHCVTRDQSSIELVSYMMKRSQSAHCHYFMLTDDILSYTSCEFDAAVPNFIIQGGDITDDNGVGGESIYGGYFEDETFEVLHNKLYLLNMANKGPDTVS